MKERIISPYTEIQAVQINELQQYFRENTQILINDVLGATTGVVKGLEPSIYSATGRIVNVLSGAICDGNGIFYELLEAENVTLPSSDNVYKIYGEFSSTTGLPVSGYTLINVETQTESFQVINTRVYDSIELGYTTSTVPTNAIHLATAEVSGNILISLDDNRVFIQTADIIANTLQGMSQSARSTAFASNELTGKIIDTEGQTKWSSVSIDDSYAGMGHYVHNGTNTGTSGFVVKVNGNKGFFSTGDGIGNYSNAASGYVFEGNDKIGYIATTNHIGFQSNGYSGLGTGFLSTAPTGFLADNKFIGFQSYSPTGFIALSSNVGFVAHNQENTTGFVSKLFGNDAVGYEVVSNATSASGKRIGLKLRKEHVNGSFDRAIELNHYVDGIYFNTLDSSTGIAFAGDGSTTNDYGIILNNVVNPIKITNDDDSHAITIEKNGTVTGNNSGVNLQLNSDSIGVIVSNNSSDVSDSIYGIYGTATNTNVFDSFLYAENYENGITLTNSAGKVGINLVGNGTQDWGLYSNGSATGILINQPTVEGIKIVNTTSCTAFEVIGQSNTDKGIVLFDVNNPIQISNPTNNASTPAIQITGNDTASSIDGMYIQEVYRGIDITDAINGIRVTNTGSSGMDYAYRASGGGNLDTSMSGYYSQDNYVGLNIDNNRIGISISNGTTHQIILEVLNANPTSATNGEIAMVNDGGGTKLRVYNGSSWTDCN